jgi:PIN domain nuclease of toxin-antitoxin system
VRLLLDSQVLVWSARSTGLISERARSALGDAGNELFVSVVSLWELTIKTALGKLSLPGTAEEAASRLNAADLPIRRPHLARLRELPPLHRDPFDRMLVAQAVEEGLVLVTSDETLRRYPVAWLW